MALWHAGDVSALSGGEETPGPTRHQQRTAVRSCYWAPKQQAITTRAALEPLWTTRNALGRPCIEDSTFMFAFNAADGFLSLKSGCRRRNPAELLR